MTAFRQSIFRWLPHLAALFVILMCGRLAVWQFDRADEKRRLLEAWASAPPTSLAEAGEPGEARYLAIRTRGEFDADHHILRDNQIRNGQTGVHVFTPFQPTSGSVTWLVNRGWFPMPTRQGPLPEVDTPGGIVELQGRVVDPPRVGLQLGEARDLDPGQWPQLVTYVDLERIDAALEAELARRVILLDPEHPAHLTGDDWQPVNFGPKRHLAYAWQWITMALVVFLIWVALTWRSLRRS